MEIYDQPYRLGSSSAEDDVRQAAAYLDEKMRRLASERGRGVALELAILAAMEVADEMLTVQQRREDLLANADERIGRFAESLEGNQGAAAVENQDNGPADEAADPGQSD